MYFWFREINFCELIVWKFILYMFMLMASNMRLYNTHSNVWANRCGTCFSCCSHRCCMFINCIVTGCASDVCLLHFTIVAVYDVATPFLFYSHLFSAKFSFSLDSSFFLAYHLIIINCCYYWNVCTIQFDKWLVRRVCF